MRKKLNIVYPLASGFILLIICSFMGCENPDNRPTYYMDQEFKDYAIFPVGSYWIYEEQTTKKSDSVHLYKQEIKIAGGGVSGEHKFEGVLQDFSTSFYSDTLSGGGGAASLTEGFPCTYGEVFKSSLFSVNVQFFSNSTVGYINKYNSPHSELEYMAFHDEFDIENHSYHDVKVFKNLIQNYSLQPEYIYYAKGVGVIRKELFNGQVWNLKRYHINN